MKFFQTKLPIIKIKKLFIQKENQKLKVWTIVLQLTRMTLNMKNY